MNPLNNPPAKPTKREREILSYIANGFSTKQIAAILHIAINTVKNHRKSLLKKFGAKNSMELIQIAYRLHLLL